MADNTDWKSRLGIPIMYNSDEEEERVQFRNKRDIGPKTVSFDVDDRETMYFGEQSAEDVLSQFDELGTTPPRTRMKIKNRDWDRKSKCNESPRAKQNSRLSRSRANRRNTMDCAVLNDMFIEDDIKRTDKRSLHLFRESERELKRSSTLMTVGAPPPTGPRNRLVSQGSGSIQDEKCESMPAGLTRRIKLADHLHQTSTIVESASRYMSVSCRPIGCRSSAPPSAFVDVNNQKEKVVKDNNLKRRQEFYEVFSNMIKLGSSDKQEQKDQKISQEDQKFQTEVNDLIWLELQAWHADRSLQQQDNYLCTARQDIPHLLNEILSYHFLRRPRAGENSIKIASDKDKGYGVNNKNSLTAGITITCCSGCLSIHCRECNEQQTFALKEIESLLTRLEAAEALYPSSQSMGSHYPIYQSAEFVGIVKTMCLWYNMTKHHRLKLAILGKHLARLEGKKVKNWPTPNNPNQSTESSSSSVVDNEDSGLDTAESSKNQKSSKVRFDLEVVGEMSDSPGESVCSEESPTNLDQNDCKEYEFLLDKPSWRNIDPLTTTEQLCAESANKFYRKYIETVLKSKGLGQSLSFLHRLHNVVLRKAQVTLEKECLEEYDCDLEALDDGVPDIEPPLDNEQEEELRRYGVWSKEFKTLNLPSYVPSFLFLSVIPLQVIHEFLRMRLEAKPISPNPLSLEQLMKELREGLILAMIHRERFNKHVHTALAEYDNELEKYLGLLDVFDKTVKDVFQLYLDYVELWIIESAPDGQRKTALEKEWMFIKLICPMISGQHVVAAEKFCLIIGKLLQKVVLRMVQKSRDLDKKISETSVSLDEKKRQIFEICRAIQGMFTTERESALKLLNFLKTLFPDIEGVDFHRDHFDLDGNDKIVTCPIVKDTMKRLQREIITVVDRLTLILSQVEERCANEQIQDLDELDRLAILTRAREILHQGYKFSFDYQREVLRLFELKITNYRDNESSARLSSMIIHFAHMWMNFVMERCERGRGVRPRWAAYGLDFLMLACDPQNTKHMPENAFEDLTRKMDACISHVIGIIPETEKVRRRASPRTRKSSPGAKIRGQLSPNMLKNVGQKSYFQQTSLLEPSVGLSPASTPTPNDVLQKQTSCDQADNGVTIKVPILTKFQTPILRQVRVRDAVNHLDMELDKKLQEMKLIGQVKVLNFNDKVHLHSRNVNFQWHRGIKIGQGRFGKVYTAVNNSTGELMAMKEIQIQPGETKGIKKVAEELKILEGISHKFLVKYYGIEIHREELLIFMELCAEGTLESLVEVNSGLHEASTRRYTAQLLSAVSELHAHGIVHRDIKPANIYLTSSGNCLKLGDFGSAVKLQSTTTVAGELQGYVGTQAYMAPEVFTKNHSEGHGRAADIWSIGCVVIEMSSGKRPWYQYDANFQIMFKVGMGETPEIPESLSEDGQEFLEHCLQHDPKKRWTANELSLHIFCRVDLDADCNCSPKDVELRRSFRKNSGIRAN